LAFWAKTVVDQRAAVGDARNRDPEDPRKWGALASMQEIMGVPVRVRVPGVWIRTPKVGKGKERENGRFMYVWMKQKPEGDGP
jgi:hypothetical protein